MIFPVHPMSNMIQKWLVVALLSPILLGACVTSKEFSCELPFKQGQDKLSGPITVDVHVDGSGSMLGYVTPNSRYTQVLESLYNTFSLDNSRSNSKVTFFRAGDSRQKLSESEFRLAQKPEFYNSSNPRFPGVTSALDSAIIPPEAEDRLFIMITDLLQNDADVTKLNRKIKMTYLNTERPGYAVGLIAIRSQFSGDIYLSSGTRKFSYDTGDKPQRPFYVLFLGPYHDIVHYFNKIKCNNPNQSDCEEKPQLQGSKFVIFSPSNIAAEPSYLSALNIEGIERIKQPSSLNDGKVSMEVKNRKRTQLLELDGTINTTLSINSSASIKPFSYTLSFDPKTLKIMPKIEAFNRTEKIFKEQPTDSSLQSALRFSDWSIDQAKKNLNFTTQLDTQELSKSGVYRFTFDLVPQGLQDLDWWQEWSWDPSRDQANDGSKTRNLLNFLQGMKDVTAGMIRNNSSPVGRFCYGIQKN